MSQSQTRHDRRVFLNPDTGMAAMRTHCSLDTWENEVYEDGQRTGKTTKGFTLNASLHLTDCFRGVTIDLDHCEHGEDTGKGIPKLENLIDEMTRLLDAMKRAQKEGRKFVRQTTKTKGAK